MPTPETSAGLPLLSRARLAAGMRGVVISGVVVFVGVLTSVPEVQAQQPRVGSSSWYNSLNARRGFASSGSGGTTAAGPNIAPNSPAGASGSVAQSVANFTQAARAIAQAQAVQAAQAQSQTQVAQAAASAIGRTAFPAVPNGLTPGGLWVNPATILANPSLWSGAALPTAAASSAATGAVGHSGGQVVTVTQTATTADLTWNTFNIGANTTLQFNQGASSWTVLNRVSDPRAAPSQILGAISAPGQVLVLNANGILFGAGSQVNVGSLVASTASLAAAQFSSILSTATSAGGYLPVFTGATSPVEVQAGASITTNVPANVTDRGGFVLLMGQSVRNDGQITTPNGQTVLAAGQNFIIRNGYGSTGPNGPYSTTEGLEVDATPTSSATSGGGSVTNTGLIAATTGDITLTGETVLQAGVLLSSTTVSQRGTIHLLTNTSDAASSITFAPGSVTAIQPEDDGSTATDTARATLIAQSATNNTARNGGSFLSNQGNLPDQQYLSRIEINSGGSVEFQSGSLGLSTGGQIAISAAGRVLADTGAALSVAGSVSTVLPATANTLQISVQGYDLRDSPANRDSGNLSSQTTNVAIGDLVQIGELQYTSGGLLEVSGYVAGVGHSIGEWTAVGGSIAVQAPEVVAQQGAVFNIEGGLVTYAAGNTPNTWLTATNGKLYNVNTAPSNLTYSGVYNGFIETEPRWGVSETFNSPLIAPQTTYNVSYSVGRDAGSLTIDAPTTVMEAAIAAGVSTGQFQVGARSANSVLPAYTLLPSSSPPAYADPFTLAQTVVPVAGTLVLGPIAGPGINPTVFNTDVAITQNGAPLAASLGLGTSIPANRVDTTWLAASVLNNAALGGLTVVTKGAIAIDASVTLADGGIVSLLAPSVEVSGSLTARGGQVTAGNSSATYFTVAGNSGFQDPVATTAATGGTGTTGTATKDTTGTSLLSSFTLGSSATIDTRGVFTNLSIDLTSAAGQAFVNGGPVTIDTSGVVTLAAGSTIDASAGGAVSANRAVKGAAGGGISITAYDPADLTAAAPSVPVTIAGTLRSFGSGAAPCTACTGGALTLAVPRVLIGAASADASMLSLAANFFAAGFSSYTITGQDGITVAPGTQVAVVQPIEQFTPATVLTPGGADPSAAFMLGLPALYTPNLASATLVQRPGASITLRAGTTNLATGGITIGAGSVISVDPRQTIGLEALGVAAGVGTQGQITIDGALIAHSGTINVVNDQLTGTSSSLSIWLGGTSVLDVSAQAATALDGFGRVFGTVPNGGTIHLGGQGSLGTNGSSGSTYTLALDANSEPESTYAFVVVQPGAVLNAAGAVASVNPNAGQTLSVLSLGRPSAGPLVQVASNGGSISIDSNSGILLGGQLSAPAGGSGAQGGTLSVDLVTPDYNGFAMSVLLTLPAYQSPRELVIGTGAAPSPGVTQAGASLPNRDFGKATLSTGQLAAGGFDVLNISSGDAILFAGSATLQSGRAITLTTAILGDTVPMGVASVVAPYVTLSGTGTSDGLSGVTFQRGFIGAAQGSPNWQPSAQTSTATLTVSAANIDISGTLFFSVNAPIVSLLAGSSTTTCAAACPVVDLPGFGTVTLSSSGDIRFLPLSTSATPTIVATPGNLVLVAGQVYPVAGAQVSVSAGFTYDKAADVLTDGNTLEYDTSKLTIASAPGPVPAPPLTAGGSLTLLSGEIDQGGVLRAPDGSISLGLAGPSNIAPKLVPNSFASKVVLEPGSITSVSMNGLTIPFGGTADGTTYTVNGAAPPVLTPQLAIYAQSIQVQQGATIDLSGGGVLAGAGFVPGRGGSTDILQAPLLGLTSAGVVTQPSASTNVVYAIVPGFAGSVAAPPATATTFTGTPTVDGGQITIGSGVPGLPAGTYTLLPGSDALLPGAFRVQLATTVQTVFPGVATIGNGSYVVDGYTGVANTGTRSVLPIQVTVTPGAAVRLDAQYNETDYASFQLANVGILGTPRASLTLPADTKTLNFHLTGTTPATGLALQIQGTVSSTPAPGGLGGVVELDAPAAPIEIVAAGGTPTPGMVSVLGSDLSGLNANTLILGAMFPTKTSNSTVVDVQGFNSSNTGVTVRSGATVSAAQVFVVSPGAVTIERGASVTTIGEGAASLDSSAGLIFSNSNETVLAVSNGTLLFQPPTLGGPIAIGACASSCGTTGASLLSAGTILTSTTGVVTLDGTTRLGTAALNLSGSVVNFGTPPASAATGLTFTQSLLQGLIAGDVADGVPMLRQLTLSASSSTNFYGTFALNTVDPATGQSTLQSFQLNSPAIYGGPGVNASLTTGTFIWNGVATANNAGSAVPGVWLGGTVAGASGSGSSALLIAANTIVLGYGPNDQAQGQTSLGRLILGFDSVSLSASHSIAGNNRGSLSVYTTGTPTSPGTGGNLTLTTPLLTGAAGSVLTVTAGGNLTIVSPGGAAASTSAQGASLTLNAATISANTAIVLPSGELTMNATAGGISLGGSSRLDLAGVTTTLFDQSSYGWGGSVTLQAASGGITQAAGGSIDVSAGNANAGSVTLIAPGVVSLAGTINGSATAGYTSGSFSVSAGGVGAVDPSSGFAALNGALDAGGFFGGRSFELLSGDLTISAGTTVTANAVSVSVDAGALTVAGAVNASGAVPGTIRLSANGGLTLAAGSLLDAHGSVPEVDSYGQSIDSENTGSVTLTSVGGMLTIAPASGGLAAPVINVSAPAGVTCALGLCGQVTLNAHRTSETGGGVNVSAAGPVNIQGAGSIVVNAFWNYAATNAAGTIEQDDGVPLTPGVALAVVNNSAGAVGLNQINNNSQVFMTAAGASQGALAGLTPYGSAFHLRPGVEIDSSTGSGGNLTVGVAAATSTSSNPNGANDLDLSGYRYSDPAGYGLQASAAVTGSGEPSDLVIRAADGLTILGSINDGFSGAPSLFATTTPNSSAQVLHNFWELAQPLGANPDGSLLLSWSIRLVGGADLAAADNRIVQPSDQLASEASVAVPGSISTTNKTGSFDPPGSVELYDPHSQPTNSMAAATAAAQLPGWSVIRTGTGDLDVLAGGSVDELSTYAIYTAGASVPLPAASTFNLPRGTVATASSLMVTLTSTVTKRIAANTTLTFGTQSFTTTASVLVTPGVLSTVSVKPVAGETTFSVPSTASATACTTGVSFCAFNVSGVKAFAPGGLSDTGTVLGTNGQAMNNGVALESLVANYSAWYPQGGGNLLISVGLDVSGYLATPLSTASSGVQPMDDVGDWLWRQGEGTGAAGGTATSSTAWWINFGTLVVPLGQNEASPTTPTIPTPTLSGFSGIGTLGGGNVTILAGRNIGESSAVASTSGFSVTQGIDVAVASTGRVAQGAANGSGVAQTGGGLLTIQAGGALNGGGTNTSPVQGNGTLTDTRGAINVLANSIGTIKLTYGTVNYNGGTTIGDPRAPSPLTAYEATPQGGPIVVPGDATVSLDALGDLVLSGAGDPTRLNMQNLTPANLNSGGAASGLTWFSLWQPGTAINLDSAGGNLVVSTQAGIGASAEANATMATDNRFLYPPTLTAIAASGSIYAGVTQTATAGGGSATAAAGASSIELAPSPTGQLRLLAAQSIYDDSVPLGLPQSFDVSGASTSTLATPFNAAFEAVGTTANTTPNIGAGVLSLFAFGPDTASGTLHAGDPVPAIIYAGGDIVDMRYGETLCFACSGTQAGALITPGTWYVSGEALRMMAGGDIVEPGTIYIAQANGVSVGQFNPVTANGNYTSTSGLIVNNNATDVSVIQAGGNIIYANATVAGPGQLYVQAGGSLYQADRGVVESLGMISDGAISAGPSRTGGAGITVAAGVSASGPDWEAFAQSYLAPATGYGQALLDYLQPYGYTGDLSGAPGFFEALPIEQQRSLLLQIYFAELRDSGREFTNSASPHFKSYIRGREAIATLFPSGSASTGSITLFGDSGIKTDFGGAITLLTPGGETSLGNTANPPALSTSTTTQGIVTPGVLTQGTGDIDIFSLGSVVLGQSRIFTTFGGSIVIWSETGDINAGNGIKSTQLVSTPLIEYDSFGRIALAPSIPTTGAGIATLAPIPGTPEGDLDLIAPLGVIDAGEAGIRVSGNANLAALAVVNAANVQVGGKTAGLPTVAAPNVSALTAASATAAAAAQTAQSAALTNGQAAQQVPSDITVDFIGFGE